MLIIPAIDIMNGKLVRLKKGIFESHKTYYDDPLEAVKLFADHGFNHINIVDLSGSRDGRISTLELLKRIPHTLDIKIQFGGGIRTLKDTEVLFNTGIDKLIMGSISVSNKPEFEIILSKYSSDKIICAVDVIKNNIMIKGWTEKASLTIHDHINYCISRGVKTFLCTDIELDGMLTGPNVKMYEDLMQQFPEEKIIASGGVSNIKDVKILKSSGVYGAVIGKAIYENKINLKKLADLAF